MVGKSVIIIKGNWKGRHGVLKNVNEKLASVELSSKNKVITLDPSFITELTEDAVSGYPKYDNNNVAMGTPRANYGNKTPAYYAQSPSYNSISSPKWNPHATRIY
jgi:transcription elongation factor